MTTPRQRLALDLAKDCEGALFGGVKHYPIGTALGLFVFPMRDSHHGPGLQLSMRLVQGDTHQLATEKFLPAGRLQRTGAVVHVLREMAFELVEEEDARRLRGEGPSLREAYSDLGVRVASMEGRAEELDSLFPDYHDETCPPCGGTGRSGDIVCPWCSGEGIQ